jgi:hypothetical protein
MKVSVAHETLTAVRFGSMWADELLIAVGRRIEVKFLSLRVPDGRIAPFPETRNILSEEHSIG